MGAKIDRIAHYLFGSAFYIILAEILSKDFPIVFSLNNFYDIFKEISSIEIKYVTNLISFFIVSSFGIIAMKISVLPDSIDKKYEKILDRFGIGNESFGKHRKFGHSIFFILMMAILFYLFFYIFEKVFSLSFFFILGINSSFMVSSSLLSHLILDLLTISGVPFFYPFSKRYFSLKLMKSGSLWMILIILFSLYVIINFYVKPLLNMLNILLKMNCYSF